MSYLSKKRLYELAKELGLSSKELLKKAKDLDIDVNTHMSTIESEEEKIIKDLLLKKDGKQATREVDSTQKKPINNVKTEQKNKEKKI